LKTLYVATVVLFLALLAACPAHADAAPPPYPPGSSIGTGGFETNVQLVSENVLLVVAEATEPVNVSDYIVSNVMTVHVEATFIMVNQGMVGEAFDVWFPLGMDPYGAGVDYANNFEHFVAWVDEVPAQITQVEYPDPQWPDETAPWATWPAAFPPGQPVTLRVSYDMRPTGYMPFGEVVYLLETGAGWYGTIGEGTITVRLPYEVNEMNVPPIADTGLWPTEEHHRDDFAASGNELVWHFTDLEPTPEDNAFLALMAPTVWEAILAAQAQVAANPDSAEAHLALGLASLDGLPDDYIPFSCEALVTVSGESFRRAIEIDPNNIAAYEGYVRLMTFSWLAADSYDLGPPPEDLLPTLERGLELDPDNETLLLTQDWLEIISPSTSTPGATNTPWTPQPTSIPSATYTIAPPTATRRPTSTATLQPPPIATPATPTPEAGGGAGCPGALGAALLPLGVLVFRRKRQ